MLCNSCATILKKSTLSMLTDLLECILWIQGIFSLGWSEKNNEKILLVDSKKVFVKKWFHEFFLGHFLVIFTKFSVKLISRKKHPILPSILAIALRGLRALKVLIVLKMAIFPNPIRLAAKLTIDTATITKSNQHQALVKYITKPIANSFRVVSKKKTTVKTRSK